MNISARVTWSLFLIVVIGIVALLVVFQNISQNKAGPTSVAGGTIIYAACDIPKGSQLNEDALAERHLARSDVPQDAVCFKSYAIGKKATYGFAKGETISVNRLTPKPGECDYSPCGSKCLTDENTAKKSDNKK